MPALAADAVALSAAPAGALSPTAAGEEPKATWYGWQTLLADGASVGLFGIALRLNDGVAAVVLAGAGVLGYVFGGPVLHWQHDREFIGYIDFTMRLGLPILIGQAAESATNGQSGFCDFICGDGANAAAAGVVVGMITAVMVDSIALSWETAPKAGDARAPRLRWTPIASPARGGATAGIGGTF